MFCFLKRPNGDHIHDISAQMYVVSGRAGGDAGFAPQENLV